MVMAHEIDELDLLDLPSSANAWAWLRTLKACTMVLQVSAAHSSYADTVAWRLTHVLKRLPNTTEH